MKSVKSLKPLIKLELMPVLGIGICLMLANIFICINLNKELDLVWRDYIATGIGSSSIRGEYADGIDLIRNIVEEKFAEVSVCYLIGVLFFSIFSMSYERETETSHFLKSIPYTTGERSLVKIGTTMVGYTTYFGIYSVVTLLIHRNYVAKFKEIYDVLAYGELQRQFMQGIDVGMNLLVIYLEILAVYLFLMLVQYIVCHKIGAGIIGICTLIAPIFIISSLGYCFSDFILENPIWVAFSDALTFIAFKGGRSSVVDIEGGSNNPYFFYVDYSLGPKIIWYAIVIGILVFGISKLSKHQLLEEADKLIPIKGFRWVFIAGVIVCGSLLACDMYRWLIEPMMQNSITGTRYFVVLVGGILSFFISNRIATSGQFKGKEVKRG